MAFETILTDELIAKYTEPGYWKNKVVTDFLDEHAEQTPDKIAYVDRDRSLTYAELKAASIRCALGLLELGVKPGDVVSFQLPNWMEWVVLHYGATRMGAILGPLIPIYREREIQFMVELAESKILVIPHEFRKYDYVKMVERIRGEDAEPAKGARRRRRARHGRRLVGRLHEHPVGGAPRPGRATGAAPRPERGRPDHVHLRHHG